MIRSKTLDITKIPPPQFLNQDQKESRGGRASPKTLKLKTLNLENWQSLRTIVPSRHTNVWTNIEERKETSQNGVRISIQRSLRYSRERISKWFRIFTRTTVLRYQLFELKSQGVDTELNRALLWALPRPRLRKVKR